MSGKDSPVQRDSGHKGAGAIRRPYEGNRMKILLVYASKYGHTAKVMRAVADECQRAGASCDVFEVGTMPWQIDLEQYDGVMLAGSVYYGKHSRALESFVLRNHMLSSIPSALLSISLAASDENGRDAAEAAVDRFVERTAWTPDNRLCVAGALSYTRYGFFVRWMMRRISAGKGSSTDSSRDHIYTNWPEVEAFARDFIATLRTTHEDAVAHTLA
jgi:menaquinone-dependent protoporphyrinogen oxidase